jgi:hypothetical protein
MQTVGCDEKDEKQKQVKKEKTSKLNTLIEI